MYCTFEARQLMSFKLYTRLVFSVNLNNQERRPITIELNLNAVTLCGGESLPVSSLTFDSC